MGSRKPTDYRERGQLFPEIANRLDKEIDHDRMELEVRPHERGVWGRYARGREGCRPKELTKSRIPFSKNGPEIFLRGRQKNDLKGWGASLDPNSDPKEIREEARWR